MSSQLQMSRNYSLSRRNKKLQSSSVISSHPGILISHNIKTTWCQNFILPSYRPGPFAVVSGTMTLALNLWVLCSMRWGLCGAGTQQKLKLIRNLELMRPGPISWALCHVPQAIVLRVFVVCQNAVLCEGRTLLMGVNPQYQIFMLNNYMNARTQGVPKE